jgi:flagellar biosynthesis/type III secretory pathway protein FliH
VRPHIKERRKGRKEKKKKGRKEGRKEGRKSLKYFTLLKVVCLVFKVHFPP